MCKPPTSFYERIGHERPMASPRNRFRAHDGVFFCPGDFHKVAPTGYLNSHNTTQKGHVFIDPQRAPVVKEIFTKVAHGGWSGRKVFRWLNEVKFVTKSGKPLTLGNIYMLLNNPFYHGTFEYPRRSGRWYQGKYEPIITKVLFDEAQQQLQLQRKARSESKEFAFTKLMTCGLYGSGITAEEKFKTLKTTGLTVRYVYYGCSRSKDLHCKNQYLREEELIKQLIEIVGQMDVNETDIRKRFDEEMQRIGKFNKVFLGQKKTAQQEIEFDARSYATYVLNEGTPAEKRELLGMLKDKLMLKNRAVTVEGKDEKYA